MREIDNIRQMQWELVVGDGTAENDFEIRTWSDIGRPIGTPLKIVRSTNIVDFSDPPTIAGIPIVITNDRLFFIETTGDDINGDGSREKPWATLQKVKEYLSCSIKGALVIGIKLGAGTFAGASFTFNDAPSFGVSGAGVDQTILSSAIYLYGNVRATLMDLTLTGGASQYAVSYEGDGYVQLINAAVVHHNQYFAIKMEGGELFTSGTIEIRQNGSVGDSIYGYSVICVIRGYFYDAGLWTITGTSNTFINWLSMDKSHYERDSTATHTGAFTGKKFDIRRGSIFDSAGFGLDYLPGDQPGTCDTSSFYDGVLGTTPYTVASGLSKRSLPDIKKLLSNLMEES
jgi:hypothetical protein